MISSPSISDIFSVSLQRIFNFYGPRMSGIQWHICLIESRQLANIVRMSGP